MVPLILEISRRSQDFLQFSSILYATSLFLSRLLYRSYLSSPQLFLGGITLYVDLYLICSWEGMSSGSYVTILDNPSHTQYLIFAMFGVWFSLGTEVDVWQYLVN